MSQSGPAPTKQSSQVPRSRRPRGGSNGSGPQQQDQDVNDNDQIPSSAVSSSTSRPQRTGRTQADGRRQSNVTFGPSPSVAPDDSISKIKTRSTWPGPNTNSDRKGSRSAREAWNKHRSKGASRISSGNGTAWSGSGPALTENNLEQLNEANEKQRSSTGYSNQDPQSDQQEVPLGSGGQSKGGQTNARRNSRRYSAAPSGNTQANKEAASGSQSQPKQQTVAASKNVIDANTAANDDSKSKSASQSRNRRDSMMESGSKAPSKPSQSPTSPTMPNWPGGWEKKTRIITRRYPDGREVREREITHRPITAA